MSLFSARLTDEDALWPLEISCGVELISTVVYIQFLEIYKNGIGLYIVSYFKTFVYRLHASTRLEQNFLT